MLIYEPYVGTYLPKELKKACSVATIVNLPVQFTFNQTTVEILPGAEVDGVVQEWLDLYRNNQVVFRKNDADNPNDDPGNTD